MRRWRDCIRYLKKKKKRCACVFECIRRDGITAEQCAELLWCLLFLILFINIYIYIGRCGLRQLMMTTLLLHSQVREQLAPGQTPPGRRLFSLLFWFWKPVAMTRSLLISPSSPFFFFVYLFIYFFSTLTIRVFVSFVVFNCVGENTNGDVICCSRFFHVIRTIANKVFPSPLIRLFPSLLFSIFFR